jgi:hypothetical protein
LRSGGQRGWVEGRGSQVVSPQALRLLLG